MVQVENRGYGYQRNFYGVRTIGRIAAFLGLLVTLGFILWPLINGKHPDLQTAYLLGFIADALIALGWYVLPSPRHVRRAGDKYAQQLLEAAATLAADSSTDKAAAPTESS